MNTAWHAKHPMPPGATLAARVRWHVAHANACGCRKMPKSVVDALNDQEQPKRAKQKAPRRRRAT